MKAILIDFLLWIVKTFGAKYLDYVINHLEGGKLSFTHARGVVYYSHYLGQNHVRKGGERKIYQAAASLTVFNPSKKPRLLRELSLYHTIDGNDYRFCLYDSQQKNWEENYSIPPHHVTSFAWQAAPSGHGLTMGHGADGIIPFRDLDTVSGYLTYLDEHGRSCRILLNSIQTHRLPEQQIAE